MVESGVKEPQEQVPDGRSALGLDDMFFTCAGGRAISRADDHNETPCFALCGFERVSSW